MMVATETEGRAPGIPARLSRLVLLLIAAMAVIFGFSIALAGVVVVITKTALTLKAGGTIALGLALLAAGIFFLRRLDAFAAWTGPVSPSVRRTRWAVVLSGALGGIIGLVLSLGDAELSAFSNGPVPIPLAIGVTAAYVILTPLFGLYWHRNADEFEKSANAKGALLGIYAYSLIAPGWWMLTRAGILPPQDPMIVFLIVIAVWGIAWMASKSD